MAATSRLDPCPDSNDSQSRAWAPVATFRTRIGLPARRLPGGVKRESRYAPAPRLRCKHDPLLEALPCAVAGQLGTRHGSRNGAPPIHDQRQGHGVVSAPQKPLRAVDRIQRPEPVGIAGRIAPDRSRRIPTRAWRRAAPAPPRSVTLSSALFVFRKAQDSGGIFLPHDRDHAETLPATHGTRWPGFAKSATVTGEWSSFRSADCPQRFLNGHAHARRPAHGLNGHIELCSDRS